MSKARSLVPFAALMLGGAILAAAAGWYRSVETPPWRVTERATQPVKTQAGSDRELPDETAGAGGFTFVTYNVKNWLVSTQSPEKTPEAKSAVIRILAAASPDVIGLSEIGSREDVEEIRAMLKSAGSDFQHMHYTGGIDPIRHLALLSRFPILAWENPDPSIRGTGHSMQRGILDATVRIAGKNIRFVGLHLKSKRTVRAFDEALLRIEESGHVRNHLDRIFAADPGAKVIAYGDFNDTTRALSTRTIYGTYRSSGYMSPVHVKDGRGETWTHRYELEDSYSRIDFVTVSSALKRQVRRDASRIIDDPLWGTASDHRPVLVRFDWKE